MASDTVEQVKVCMHYNLPPNRPKGTIGVCALPFLHDLAQCSAGTPQPASKPHQNSSATPCNARLPTTVRQRLQNDSRGAWRAAKHAKLSTHHMARTREPAPVRTQGVVADL